MAAGGVRLQEFKMIDHRMRLIAAEPTDDAQQDWPRLRAARLKLDLAFAGVGLNIVQPFEEIDVPRHAPVFAVGDGFQPHRLLLLDDVFDLAILDVRERFGSDFAARPFVPRLTKRGGAEQAADVIGAKRRCGAWAHVIAAI